MAAGKTWILTGSLENFRINVERGFDVIGFKERRRRQAEQMAPGDEIVFYVTGVQEFGGIARVTSEMYEEREPIWPGSSAAASPPDQLVRGRNAPARNTSKKHPEAYPWRVDAEPVAILDEENFVPAVELAGELEHVAKWPAEHWHLAFQGQLRTVGEADAKLLRERIGAAGPGAAARGRAGAASP